MPLQRRPPGMHFLLGFPVFPELTNWVAGSPSNHKLSSMSTHFGTVCHPNSPQIICPFRTYLGLGYKGLNEGERHGHGKKMGKRGRGEGKRGEREKERGGESF